MISFSYRYGRIGLGVVEGTQNGTHSRNQKRARRAADHTWNGFIALAIGLALAVLGLWQLFQGVAYGRSGSVTGLVTTIVIFVLLFVAGLLFLSGLYTLQPNEAAHPAIVRQLPGHDTGGGAARHQPVLYPAQGLAARAQSQRRAAQGQRQARQPDRDRGGRGVARRRHRQGELRCRQLRELRQAAERGRGAPSRGIVCLRPRRRRARRRGRADAARRQPTSLPARWSWSCSSGSPKPASSSTKRG